MNTRRVSTYLVSFIIVGAICAGLAQASERSRVGIAELPETVKAHLAAKEKIIEFRHEDVDRDGIADYIVYTRQPAGFGPGTSRLRVFLGHVGSDEFSEHVLVTERDITCSDFEFIPGEKKLSAVVSVWSMGGSGGQLPVVHLVLDRKFVRFSGFQQLLIDRYAIKREGKRVFLVGDTPIRYHHSGRPFSPRSVYYGFKGNLFINLRETSNEPSSPAEMINKAAWHFLREDYRTAAGIYQQVYEAVTASGAVTDASVDLAVESLFYLAKSQELAGMSEAARANYDLLIAHFPEHWLAVAARGELKELE